MTLIQNVLVDYRNIEIKMCMHDLIICTCVDKGGHSEIWLYRMTYQIMIAATNMGSFMN